MDYKFSDLVDIAAIQEMMECLWNASKIPVGIIDTDGRVLVATGWQDICTKFHRRNSETELLCRESDSYLQELLVAECELPPCGYFEYHCKNGMIDIAVPIMIEGRHLATLFLGQFFYDPPDEAVFREQAKRYGFSENSYLTALRKVPIFNREKVEAILAYHSRFVELLTQMGLQTLKSLQTQAALCESEERFRSIFASSAAPMGLIGPDGELLQINQAACDFIGYGEEELLQMNIAEVTHPDDREETRVLYDDFLAGRRKKANYEKRYLRKDGSEVWGHITLAPAWDHQGKLLYLVGMMQDISDRKQKEQELLYREAFETLIAGISTRFVELPTKETDRGINQALEDLGRFDDVDRSYVFLLSEDRKRVNNTHEWCAAQISSQQVNLQQVPISDLSWGMGKILKRQTLYVPSVKALPPEAVVEQQHWTAQGIQSLIVVPILASGEVIGFLGLDKVRSEKHWGEKDITLLQTVGNLFGNAIERQRSENALRESERKLVTLLDNLPGMAYSCRNDSNWTMVFVSEGCHALTGYLPEDLQGNKTISYAEVIHPEDRDYVWQQVQQAVENREPFQFEYRIKVAGGEERWVLEQGRGIFSPAGKLLALEGFVSDITARRKAVKTLQQNDRMKTEFVKTVAHEFRTPLTAIQGYAELLLSPMVLSEQEQKDSLRYIHERSCRLAEMVGEMLNVVRIENGKALALNTDLFQVGEIFLQIEPFLKNQLAAALLNVDLEKENTVLSVDMTKIIQVFENLLSNAMKFSDGNSPISIEGRCVDDYYRFSIIDQGIGMSLEHREKIFEKFYRIDASDSAVPGIGLGMSIVKHIIEAHGGKIWVESGQGIGTTVSFTLPLWREEF